MGEVHFELIFIPALRLDEKLFNSSRNEEIKSSKLANTSYLLSKKQIVFIVESFVHEKIQPVYSSAYYKFCNGTIHYNI